MIQRGNCKGTHFSRNLNQETSKKETEDKEMDLEEKEFVGRIEDTPENISAFVVSADFNCNYALVDDMDTVKVFTMGNYLDLVPDTEYLEKELRPVLLQMQFGETEVPNVKYEPIKKSLEEFLGEKDLQLATEDTYKSMSETSKSFEEIEQDEFNHDDIEI